MELHLCKDFPDFPGGRFIDQGDFSGEYTPSVIQDIMQYMNTAIEAIENPTTSFNNARQNFTAEISCNGKLKKLPPINGCAVSDTTEKTLEKQEKEVIAPP